MLRLGSLYFIYILCLANPSAESKPHPMEGAEVYAGCEIPGSCKVCCVVCTPLCAGRCAPCMRSLFVCCRDFAFSKNHDIFLRNKQRIKTPSYTAYDPPVPWLGKIQAARGSLYSTRILCPILLPFPEHVCRQLFHHLALSFDPSTHDNN